MNFVLNNETPAITLGYGYIPEAKRGVIHSTPYGDREIKRRAARGPAKMGRNKGVTAACRK